VYLSATIIPFLLLYLTLKPHAQFLAVVYLPSAGRLFTGIQITLDTYSHVVPGLQVTTANRFDEAFTSKYNEREAETVEKD